MRIFNFLQGCFSSQVNQLLAILFLATLSSVSAATRSTAAMPFSPEQKADIIERINICREPKFNDGYETPDFKISIFEEQDGGFVYCGYNKATKARIVLPAVKGEANSRILWKAVNKNVEYLIEFIDEATYELRIVKNGSVIYKAEAWSIYPP
jgi:hypothetical protein